MKSDAITSPRLDPPCLGWQADLPLPDDPSNTAPSLGFDAPNHLDEIYLEVSRRSSGMRGILMGFTIILLWMEIGLIDTISQTWKYIHVGTILSGFFAIFLGIWSGALFMRVDIAPPRDQPLRFNRLRRKLYAYNFKYRWWNPFGRWRVVPVAYDWSQARAEAWKQRGMTANGVLMIKWGIMLSIVAPGTNKVIDRFFFSTMDANEHAWAYVCTYMQHGPQALPPSLGQPRDPNDVPWYNLALRLAPKVKWPKDMDIESRTAPLHNAP